MQKKFKLVKKISKIIKIVKKMSKMVQLSGLLGSKNNWCYWFDQVYWFSGVKRPNKNKNTHFTLRMTMPQAAGKTS